MATKKKSNKKPLSTWQWFRSLSNGHKTLLFVLIFAVLGGGFAVYKSFAYSWTQVYKGYGAGTDRITVSACRLGIVPKRGTNVKWAVFNESNSRVYINLYIADPSNTSSTIRANLTPRDILVLPGSTTGTAGQYRIGWLADITTNTYIGFTFSMDPSRIVACDGGK